MVKPWISRSFVIVTWYSPNSNLLSSMMVGNSINLIVLSHLLSIFLIWFTHNGIFTSFDICRHDICHVTAPNWRHTWPNASFIPDNRCYEAISAFGLIKNITRVKGQTPVCSIHSPRSHTGCPRINSGTSKKLVLFIIRLQTEFSNCRRDVSCDRSTCVSRSASGRLARCRSGATFRIQTQSIEGRVDEWLHGRWCIVFNYHIDATVTTKSVMTWCRNTNRVIRLYYAIIHWKIFFNVPTIMYTEKSFNNCLVYIGYLLQ